MPYLKQQIELVNTLLKPVAFGDSRFASAKIEAIAVDVARTDSNGARQIFPAVLDQNFEPQEITVNDTYPLVVYHKVIATAYRPDANNYGQGVKKQVQTTQVKMVVYAKSSAIKMTRETLEAVLITNFPDNPPAASYADLNLDNLTITVQGSNLNSMAVWMEEYKGFEFPLAADDILFSITYTIQSLFRKGCFKLCDCN
jgi:hypothetical protein